MTDSTDKADLEKRPEQVSAMFDKVSRRYDLTNDVLTFGIDRLWRVATTRALAPKPGERILDLAAGTGTSSVSFATSGAYVVAGDFSEGMLEEGRRRYGHIPNVEFAWADATDLPFSDDSFDAVTISWGLRNVVDPHKALEEMLRVTRPGGRLVVCEFSTPPNALFRRAYRFYNDAVMPLFVRLVSSDAAAYDYLDESIRDWPAQKELASWLRDAGWERVAHRDLTGGIAALHRGVKPHA